MRKCRIFKRNGGTKIVSRRIRKVMGTGEKLKIGDRVSRFPVCFLIETGYCDPKVGTVTYIHPKHRFHTVEFRAKNGYKWRESYFGDLDIIEKEGRDYVR